MTLPKAGFETGEALFSDITLINRILSGIAGLEEYWWIQMSRF